MEKKEAVICPKMKNSDSVINEEISHEINTINGANIICKNRDIDVNPNSYIMINNLDEKTTICTIGTTGKLSDYFDRLPYGIIDKKITGIGATTLEMNSPRNSIIVFPTKALAYNKHISKKLNNGYDSCIYVGSPIGEITSIVTSQDIESYLKSKKYKKFFVVADSLPKVLNCIGEANYNDYFIMIDEIDSLQSDSTYRPALENVIDYYCKFPKENRACVSATIREFSHPVLKDEPTVIISYKAEPKRDIELKYTTNEDQLTVNVIMEKLKGGDNKVLIAYNSLDGILQCIKLLENSYDHEVGDKIGILCSDQNKAKVEDYMIKPDEDGSLSKQIVFMTCAYFVGIDISDRCHLISVSTSNQPFTLISEEKLTQISGRCRNGLLSETIIYTSSEIADRDDDIEQYRNKILRKTEIYASIIQLLEDAQSYEPDLFNINEKVKDVIEHVSTEKIAKDYPVKLLRKDIKGDVVPSYLNIDALIERYNLHYSLYNKQASLPAILLPKHNITEIAEHPEPTEFQMKSLESIKGSNSDRKMLLLNEIKDELIRLKDSYQLQHLYIAKTLETANKDVRKYLERFLKLSPYINTEYLATKLLECQADERLFTTFNNSLILFALEDKHPLRIEMLGEFDYSIISGAKEAITDGKKVKIKGSTSSYIKIRMDKILKREFSYRLEPNLCFMIFRCFFDIERSGAKYKIIGLNPEGHPTVLKKITDKPLNKLLELKH